MKGRREVENSYEDKTLNWGKIGIILVIIVLVVLAVVFAMYLTKKEEKTEIVEKTAEIENIVENENVEEIDGYSVLGKLFIEKIELEQYILDSKETSAMEIASVKLYGNELNQEGNFCIAGHNYEEIFARLNELEVGDEFYIEDIGGIIQDYKIMEITQIEPTDLTCLMPVTDKIQVTLITCLEGATERLVIRAERIEIEE